MNRTMGRAEDRAGEVACLTAEGRPVPAIRQRLPRGDDGEPHGTLCWKPGAPGQPRSDKPTSQASEAKKFSE